MSHSSETLFSAIELGTHTIKVVVAEASGDSLNILGYSELESLMVLKGEIGNFDMVKEQLSQAITQIQDTCDIDIQDTFISLIVSGNYLSQNVVTADVNVNSRDHLITDEDLDRSTRTARQHDVSGKVDVLSTSARYYTLPDGRQVLNPKGLAATSFQLSMQSILARKDRLAPPVNLVSECIGRPVNDLCYAPMALGKACLSADDVAQDGQILIDIGAGVTSYALFTSAGCHTAGQLTVGFDQAANDLSIAFDLSMQHARHLLKDFAALNLNVISRDDGRARLIAVEQGPGITPRRIAASSVEKVVQARFSELFEIILEFLQKDNAWQWCPGGKVWLSGGASNLPGMTALAHNILAHETVIARPFNVTGPKELIMNPAFMAPVGAIRNAKETFDIYLSQTQDANDGPKSATSNFLSLLKQILNI